MARNRIDEYAVTTAPTAEMRRAVEHLWIASANLERALRAVQDSDLWKEIDRIRGQVDQAAFAVDGKATEMERPAVRKSPPPLPKRK